MTNLTTFASNLPSIDCLIGLRVFDKINEEFVYIQSVEDGIFCTTRPNSDRGNYYKMRDLAVADESQNQ